MAFENLFLVRFLKWLGILLGAMLFFYHSKTGQCSYPLTAPQIIGHSEQIPYRSLEWSHRIDYLRFSTPDSTRFVRLVCRLTTDSLSGF